MDNAGNNKIIKRRVTYKELVEMGLIPWYREGQRLNDSLKTTVRKIENEDFPAIKEAGRWYFEPDKVDNWFKRRTHKAS